MATICPACSRAAMEVMDSRPSGIKNVLRRRRQRCVYCDYKCTTHEVIVSDDTGHVSTHINAAFRFKKEMDELLVKYFGSSHRITIKKEPKE